MKNKLETRTHNKHIQVKTIRTWVMDCIEKIIPTVYEINTSIYKLMWRKKKLKPLPSLIFKPWSYMPPTTATLLSKPGKFQ